ncbi:MAG: hypothetical protein KGQ66_11720 [Acidobacteriota bacterium]|nr:hypothetical protein [Acidobacteriota bacterium]
MRRDEFRDALRRAAEITGDIDLVVIGSQSIHGAFAPAVLPLAATASGEVDIMAAQDIDGDKMWLLAGRGGGWGDLAEIDGVDITTATLPEGWVDRLIAFPLDDQPDCVIGWCLDPQICLPPRLSLVGRRTTNLSRRWWTQTWSIRPFPSRRTVWPSDSR